jgi:hypothetical protein
MSEDRQPRPPAEGDAAKTSEQSFTAIERQARAVLRERGLSDEQIEIQLNLAKRDDWNLSGPPDSADKGDSGQKD